MKNTNLSARLSWVNQFLIAMALILVPLTGAYAACCAGHGGVASCNKATGHQMCKDGSASPTCMCTKGKNTKATTTTTTGKSKPATTTTTSPKSSWWGGKSTSTKTPATSTKSTTVTTSAKGCCSNHGGVAQCNKAAGHLMCKDGTQSPGCPCH